MGGNAAAGVANMGSNSASQMGEYGLQGANALATGALTAGNLNGQFKQDLFNQIAGQFGFTMGGGGSSGGSGMNSLMGGMNSAGGSMGSGLESMFGLGAIGII
jgi:hypothetical protein